MIAANGKVPDAEHSNLVSSTQSFISLSSTEATHPESKTSADELALDVSTLTSSSHRTPVRAQITSSTLSGAVNMTSRSRRRDIKN